MVIQNLHRSFITAVVALLLATSIASMAQAYESYDEGDAYAPAGVYDPYEDINRAIYDFNDVLDRYFLIPVVETYRFVFPSIARDGISNIIDNIRTPVTFINATLQGDAEYAATSFWRFIINSTLGGAGIMDVASAAGMEERTEDFGQTLGVYGVDAGAYLVLPFLGPSSMRDAGGRVVDAFSNPLFYDLNDEAYIAYKAVEIVDGRHRTLDITNELNRTSLDPYAALRSLYLQNREDRVRNGAPR